MSGYAIDTTVILAYFTLIIGIGLYAARGQKTMQSYALGNRSMPWWAVLASILASEISAATFLGAPGEGYEKLAYTYALLAIGTIIARLIVAGVFIKPFYDMKVVSIYEYLENRFGVLTKRVASAVFLLTRSLASGSRLFVAAILIVLAYEQVMGMKLEMQVAADRQVLFWIYLWAVVALTAVTALYTALGGIKAVVWTDLIQVSLMFGAAGFVFWSLWHSVGGGTAVAGVLKKPVFWDTGFLASPPWPPGPGIWDNVKNILSSEYTIWSAFLGSVFTTMATHGTDQDMVQRMLTAQDTRRSRWAVVGSGLLDVPVVLLFLTIGIMLHLYYTSVKPGGLPAGEEAFPWFMVHDLKPGLRGLLAAGLFATAMGSLSTALNALATSFTRDWYLGVFRPGATDNQQFRVARWSTVGFAVILATVGIATAALKLANPELRIIPIVLGSFGYTYGSLLGVFLLGMLTQSRGSCRGNVVAMACGLAATLFLTGAPNDVYDIWHEKEARVRRAAESVLQDNKSIARPLTAETAARLDDPTIAAIAAKARLDPAGTRAAFRHPNALSPWFQRSWLPVIAFPWRVMAGTIVTFLVGLCFPSPGRRAGKG